VSKGSKQNVGVFLLGGFLLFAVGLFLIGDRRQIFSDNMTLYAEFADLEGFSILDLLPSANDGTDLKTLLRSLSRGELPEAPIGVPDEFGEHVKLMMDLQVLAFMSDTTRVFSFKMGRDGSARVYPDSGAPLPFHPASHHGGKEDRVEAFAKINRYHVSFVPYLLEKLQSVQEGDANLLDKTLIMYGSPMGDSNLHNHKRCPLFLAGGANGLLAGDQHLRADDGTPMANVFLSLAHGLGMDDMDRFGDSTGTFALS